MDNYPVEDETPINIRKTIDSNRKHIFKKVTDTSVPKK